MAYVKVMELPTAKMADREVKNWRKWTGKSVRKKKLANGWYAVYADTSQLNPAARIVLGF